MRYRCTAITNDSSLKYLTGTLLTLALHVVNTGSPTEVCRGA
jgi:hypothetical protein